MRNELPEFYFFVLPDTGQLVTIRRNEHGYYHSDWSTGDTVRNQEIADMLQGMMVIINIPVIVILAKPAVDALKDYQKQRAKEKTGNECKSFPVFRNTLYVTITCDCRNTSSSQMPPHRTRPAMQSG